MSARLTTPLAAVIFSFVLSPGLAGAQASAVGSYEDCSSGDVHDNGTAGGDLGGGPGRQTDFRLVTGFVPPSYPYRYTAVCVALIATDPETDLSLEILAYRDDGPDGSPGTLLWQGAEELVDMPHDTGQGIWQFYRFEIPENALVVEQGGLYLGVRWNPTAEDTLVGVVHDDEVLTLDPPAYTWNEFGQTWHLAYGAIDIPREVAFMIRAVGPQGVQEVPALSATSAAVMAFVLAAMGVLAGRRMRGQEHRLESVDSFRRGRNGSTG